MDTLATRAARAADPVRTAPDRPADSLGLPPDVSIPAPAAPGRPAGAFGLPHATPVSTPVAPGRSASAFGVPRATPVAAAPAAAFATPARETTAIGALIRSHRLRIGLTQRELADLSTISVRAIRDLEQGKARRPRSGTVQLVADALRLGPRARAALAEAARQGRGIGPGRQEPTAPPTALHAMVGREGETQILASEVAESGTERLVNVVGLAGVGKTRLALAVAERLHGAGLPVLWHTFTGHRGEYLAPEDAALTAHLAALAAELFAQDGPGADPAVTAAAAAASWNELVGDAPALLVLDGAPASPPRADRLTALLRACPGLRLLVTSDAPWGVPGERIFLLSPLELPGDDTGTSESPAVRLFLDHVRRARPDFAAAPADVERAGAVCRLLDGHPGALVAAASWLVVYDLATLCGCLTTDPAALLDHLDPAGGTGDFRTRLCDRLARLRPGPRALLDALSTPAAPHAAAPGRGHELSDLTRLTGLTPAECGRFLRDLLLSGTVSAVYRDGASRFHVLGLVRAALARPASATAAAH
ncbi:AAA family ATPase [Streptomyces sp. AHA2]|uniref:AAA family ATPase n=1 Tax=Streptomyces sp. AHA2 TaxID=3064526 RepID=UPI002FE1FD01